MSAVNVLTLHPLQLVLSTSYLGNSPEHVEMCTASLSQVFAFQSARFDYQEVFAVGSVSLEDCQGQGCSALHTLGQEDISTPQEPL